MSSFAETNPNVKPLAEESLQTSRLVLRPVRREDAADVLAIRCQDEVSRWLRTQLTSLAEADDWIQSILNEPKAFCFCIELRDPVDGHSSDAAIALDNPKMIGTIGTRNLPDIGYSFHPGSWGHGYATEALRAVLSRYWSVWPSGCPLLDENDRKALVAATFADNLASANVLRKAGFQLSGGGEVETSAGLIKTKKWRAWGPGFEHKE